jgi:hypothetical protein
MLYDPLGHAACTQVLVVGACDRELDSVQSGPAWGASMQSWRMAGSVVLVGGKPRDG